MAQHCLSHLSKTFTFTTLGPISNWDSGPPACLSHSGKVPVWVTHARARAHTCTHGRTHARKGHQEVVRECLNHNLMGFHSCSWGEASTPFRIPFGPLHRFRFPDISANKQLDLKWIALPMRQLHLCNICCSWCCETLQENIDSSLDSHVMNLVVLGDRSQLVFYLNLSVAVALGKWL